MRRRALAWPAAFLAVAGLHALAAWKAPPAVPLEEVPDHVGERVRVGGRLREVRPLDGALLAEVTDGSLYLPALLRGQAHRSLEPGDEVRLTGIVGMHEGAHEIRGRAGDVRVLETRGEPLSPSTVARTPRRFAETPVRVAGWTEGEPGAWAVADAEAALAMEPEDGDGLRPDLRVVARGTLAYDPGEARYVLEDAAWRRR